MRKPPRLRPGDRVALVAPASPLDADGIDRACENVRALGFEPVLGAHARESAAFLAGSDAARAADFNAALADPAIRAVFALRGGYGTMRILDQLDYGALARDPKVVLGYSDLTAPLNAFAARSGVVTFHGPVASAPLSEAGRERLLRALTTLDPLEPLRTAAAPIVTGTARGHLVGGNLSLVAHLCGTPFAVATRGAILALEDVNEAPYRIDRLLTQLRLAGAFTGAAGFAFGDLEHLDVVAERIGDLGIPAACGLPFGHIDEQWLLPIGLEAELDGAAGVLRFAQSGVS
ncbi:MAG: LD-carboxypeptidase [bacterium]|nr:LD-carboxypeptidase [bacterium]